jgi:hypothetical protein
MLARKDMTIRTVFLAGAAAAALLACATQASADENVVVEPYHYGMHLDVAKVVNWDVPESTTTKVVTATMTYLDSQGQLHKMSYPRMAEGIDSGD